MDSMGTAHDCTVRVDGVEFPAEELQESEGDVIFFVDVADISAYKPIPTEDTAHVATPEQEFRGAVHIAVEHRRLTVRIVETLGGAE